MPPLLVNALLLSVGADAGGDIRAVVLVEENGGVDMVDAAPEEDGARDLAAEEGIERAALRGRREQEGGQRCIR